MLNLNRARGYYLYSLDRSRFLDLSVGAGQFFLGRKYGKSQLFFKNAVEKGLTSFTDEVSLNRTQKAVKNFVAFFEGTRFSDYEFLPILKQSLFSLPNLSLDKKKSSASLFKFPHGLPTWRPWLSSLEELSATEAENLQKTFGTATALAFSIKAEPLPEVFVIANPFPFSEAPVILGVNKKAPWLEAFKKCADFPSSPFLQGTARAFCDALKFCKEYSFHEMKRFDSILQKFWTRVGPWLFPKCTIEEYADFKAFCLSKKIVISEQYTEPSFVPPKIDGGELRHL